jgi:uncharacterized alkaline shock family protein YloU
MTDPRWERLPCGRNKEHLLEIVADDRAVTADSHEATCPYCQTALAELGSLWDPFRQWTGRSVQVPPRLVRTVIARVRRMTQSPHHVVAATARGVTSVTSWVIAQLGAEATLRVPGVASLGQTTAWDRWASHTGVVRQGADAIAVTEVGAEAVSLRFSLSVRPVTDVLTLADTVRSEVIDELRRQAAVEVAEVDILIEAIDWMNGDSDEFTSGAEL